MIFTHLNKKGVTLMEVIVSSIIFALILIAMANLFIAGRRYILHARARMTGTELGRHFLDPLQLQVRQDQWGTAGHCLSTGAGCDVNPGTAPITIDNVQYQAEYTVTDGPGGAANTDVRKVTTRITWQEPTP